MIDSDLQRVSARIRQELVELERVLQRINVAWQRATQKDDDYYLEALRSICMASTQVSSGFFP